MRKQKLKLTGDRYGPVLVTGKGSKPRYWKCQCDCGRVFEARGSRLKSGTAKCECQRTVGHGHARRSNHSPEYRSWQAMKARVKSDRNYQDVTLDPRWERFENFLADMRERPKEYSLDRANPWEGYTPENCRWAPRDVQAANKRGARALRYDWAFDGPDGKRYGGAVATVAEWAWYLRRMTSNNSWTTQKLLGVLDVLSLEEILRAASPWGIPPEEFSLRAGREFQVMWDSYLKDTYLQAA